MTRTEAYSFIKEHNLAEDVKAKYGRHYTNVPTNDLISYVTDYSKETTKESKETSVQTPKEQASKEFAGQNLSRPEMYKIIKESGKAEEIKKEYGRHFTNLPTAILVSICASLNQNQETVETETSVKNEEKPIDAEVPHNTEEAENHSASLSSEVSHNTKLERLIAMLAQRRILLKSELAELNSLQ